MGTPFEDAPRDRLLKVPRLPIVLQGNVPSIPLPKDRKEPYHLAPFDVPRDAKLMRTLAAVRVVGIERHWRVPLR